MPPHFAGCSLLWRSSAWRLVRGSRYNQITLLELELLRLRYLSNKIPRSNVNNNMVWVGKFPRNVEGVCQWYEDRLPWSIPLIVLQEQSSAYHTLVFRFYFSNVLYTCFKLGLRLLQLCERIREVIQFLDERWVYRWSKKSSCTSSSCFFTSPSWFRSRSVTLICWDMKLEALKVGALEFRCKFKLDLGCRWCEWYCHV